MSNSDHLKKNEIQSELVKFLEENFLFKFDGEIISQNKNLFQEGLIDSFGLIDLVSYIEDRWNFELNDDDLTSPLISSLDGLTNLVFMKLQR
jgi:D-alanine--poly(phosphoribitol) ligase subunit 2